jgi:pimeloyl-ACP methyl ester carboxylesterase
MKNRGKFLKWIGLAIIIFIVIIICSVSSARFLNIMKTKITTENGIQENIMVEIGGIKQYLQIRGKNKDNPVVVFLHGGPGSPTTFINYTYQLPLEENYTFASWDQRGCGRTYYANPDMDMKAQLSKDILLKDLDDLVDYLRSRFKQDKVIIMGHSWGTVLGSEYVQKHPEKVIAYLGVGQSVRPFEGYNMAAREAMRLAKEQNNTEDVNRLTAIITKLDSTKSPKVLELNQITGIQRFAGKYMAYESRMSAFGQIWMGTTSPYFSFDDLKWYLKAMLDLDGFFLLQDPLMIETTNFDINNLSNQYKVPMYYISGEADWTTPTTMVEEYYKSVKAPDKNMVVIKNAGHSPFIDQPKLFHETVKSLLSRID